MPTHETNTTPKTGLARERITMPNHTNEQKLSNDDGPQSEQSGCMSNGLQPSLCRGSTAASAQGLECPTDGAFTRPLYSAAAGQRHRVAGATG